VTKKKDKQEEGQELSSTSAILRAANFLDEVGMIAWRKRDTETLLTVTEGWLKIAEILDDEASEIRKEKRIIGFAPENNDKE
jgi:hypothetical protein